MREKRSRTEQLAEAFTRVIERMDTRGESVDAAVAAVAPDYPGRTFAIKLRTREPLQCVRGGSLRNREPLTRKGHIDHE